MSRRGTRANLREEAIELLALGETTPADVAAAVGIDEAELRRWRKQRVFSDTVAQRSRELLRDAIPFVLARILEQAKAGQAAQQRQLLQYHLDLEKLDLERQAGEWVVRWDDKPAAASPPVKDDDDDPAPAAPAPTGAPDA